MQPPQARANQRRNGDSLGEGGSTVLSGSVMPACYSDLARLTDRLWHKRINRRGHWTVSTDETIACQAFELCAGFSGDTVAWLVPFGNHDFDASEAQDGKAEVGQRMHNASGGACLIAGAIASVSAVGASWNAD